MVFMLPIHVSDTAANSKDGSYLEFVTAAAARECNIQDARGGGLCLSVKSQTRVATSVASARYLDKLSGVKNHSVFSARWANVYLLIKHQPTI